MYQRSVGYAPPSVEPQQRPKRDPARGQRIQELRRTLGFTSAAALAERLSVHVRSVENWEAGRPVDGPNLGRLAQALDTTTDYIWTGHEETALSGDEVLDRLAAVEGRIAREADLARFVRANSERITRLEQMVEESVRRVEGELAALRELMEGTATAVKSLRTAGVAPPQPEAVERPPRERRAIGGRRRSDPPLPPGQ
jgi:transcriptional regulator with XRE-family HTH domain